MAFSLNSANPNVAATGSTSVQVQVPPLASGRTRRLWRDTCAKPSSDSTSVKVVIKGPATGVLGLLVNPPAAAEPTTSLADSGVCATTPGLQHSDLYLRVDLDVSMSRTDSDAGAEG